MNDKVNLSTDRQQSPFETDFDYKNRIARLDYQAEKMRELFEACVPRDAVKSHKGVGNG